MKNCEKCGNQLNDNNKFCVKCGTPTQKSAPQKEKIVKPKKEVDEKTVKQRKLIAIVAAVILVVGFTVYKIGESITSRDKVVGKFITAMTEKNTSELANMLKSSDPRMEINEENLKPFIEYLEENPSYFDHLVKSIEEDKNPQTKNLKSTKRDIPVFSREEDSNNNIIELKKKGKKYLIYDNYEFVIQPFFVRISTNYKDAVIYMNDKELGKSDSENFSKEYGPFAPGKYTIKSVYSGEYTTIETGKEIYLVTDYYDSSTKVFNHDLYLDGRYVYVETNYYDGQVIINGKNSNLTAEEINKTGLGPVDDATVVQLSKEFPWGTITSEEAAVGDYGSYLDLYINPINNDVQNAVMEAVNIFLHDDTEAFKARDAARYTNLMDPELSSRKERIQDMISWDRYDIIEMESAIYDLNSHKIYQEGNEYLSQINGVYNYKRAYYYEGDDIPELADQYSRWKYNLKYDDQNKKWIIYRLDSQYYFDDSNTKEYSFIK